MIDRGYKHSNKHFMDSSEYLQKRAAIQKEINSHPFELNTIWFQKSPEDRVRLKHMKRDYKKALRES